MGGRQWFGRLKLDAAGTSSAVLGYEGRLNDHHVAVVHKSAVFSPRRRHMLRRKIISFMALCFSPHVLSFLINPRLRSWTNICVMFAANASFPPWFPLSPFPGEILYLFKCRKHICATPLNVKPQQFQTNLGVIP